MREGDRVHNTVHTRLEPEPPVNQCTILWYTGSKVLGVVGQRSQPPEAKGKGKGPGGGTKPSCQIPGGGWYGYAPGSLSNTVPVLYNIHNTAYP